MSPDQTSAAAAAAGPCRAALVALPVLAMLAYSHDAVLARFARADPAVVAAGRFAVAALALWPLALWRDGEALRRLGRGGLALTAAAGALLAADFWAWTAAVQRTSVANSLLLTHMAPVWAVLFAACWLRRRPRPVDLAVVVLSVAGAGVVARGGAMGEAGGSLEGDLLAILSSVPSAAFLVLTAATAARLPVLAYACLAWSWAALMLAAAGLLAGADPPRELEVLGAILAAGLLAQLVGHGLLTWSARWLSPLLVAVCCLAEPLLGALWGLLYLGEGVGPSSLAGGGFVLAAIYLGARHGGGAGVAKGAARAAGPP